MISLFLLLWVESALAQDQWRLVYQDGSVDSVWGAPQLDAEKQARLQYAWVWSERRAPRRIEAGEMERARFPADAPRLEVRVVRPPGARPSAETRVIAGPIDMWRDLPEGLLPSWPVPASGRLSIPHDPGRRRRLRLAGPREGSWWVDVAPGRSTALLSAVEAEGIRTQVLDPQGEPLAAVNGAVLEGAARQGANRLWATLRGEEGRLSVPGLPDLEEIAVSVSKPGYMPASVRGRPSELPERLQLGRGATLSGRVADAEGRPIADAAVEAETWISPQVAQLYRTRARSRPDGTWSMAGVPPGPAFLSVRAPGFAPAGQQMEARPGATDLGTLTLTAGLAVSVLAVDEQGTPVTGARVEGSGLSAETDAMGKAELAGVTPGAPLKLTAQARRHLPGKVQVNPPLPAQVRIELPRAHTVRGRFLEAPGLPAAGALAQTEQASCQKEGRLDDEGRFELDLPSGETITLVLHSPRTRELRLVLPRGSAGEVTDLGDLTPPPGRGVAGRVVRAGDGVPVAGVRVWLPRPGRGGALFSWAGRDLLEAQTGEDGRFLLSGLAPGPAFLRVDAAGFARAHLDLQVAEEDGPLDAGPLDAGEIRLVEGSLLRVFVDDSAEPPETAVARVDLRGEWIEPDMLTAPVRDGEATFRNVPPGPALVSVVAGRKLLCERRVEVPAGAGEIEADCLRSAVTVAGQVRVGGAPAGSGMLLWQPPATTVASRIDNVVSPGGLRRQTIVGEGRPQVDVQVGPEGSFRTGDLTPGRWQVAWVPETGVVSGSQEIEIPEVEHFEAVITYPGLAVTGQVVDQDERPAEGARVRELTTGALAFTAADGSFTLAGLNGPKAVVQAQLAELSSPVLEIELDPGIPAEPVLLILDRRAAPTFDVRVVRTDGSPAAGAFVFLEEEGKGVRVLSVDAQGKASASFQPPLPARVRAAATLGGSWALGSWLSWEEAGEGVSLGLAEGGGLLVGTEDRQGSPLLLSPDGWDLSRLLRLLGSPASLAPGQPFRLDGLPAGTWVISLDGSSVSVTVRAGELAEARLGN